MAVLLCEKCVEKVCISPSLSHFDYPFSVIVNAFFWGLTGWVTAPWENTCRRPLLRLDFFRGDTQWGTFQTWDLSAKKSKAPQGAASEAEGGQGTLVKHAVSDDRLILHPISSSTTRFVIIFSSKETPDVTGAAMVPEKHLVSHSVAQVGKLLPILPCSVFSGCSGKEFSIDIQRSHSALVLNHGVWTFQILNCTMYFQESAHMDLY